MDYKDGSRLRISLCQSFSSVLGERQYSAMLLLSLSFLLFFSHVPFSYADLITDSNSTVTNTSLTWQTDCTLYGFTDPSLLPGLSCGTYEVPLDYGNISVGSVTLALAKLSAVKEPRLGSLFVNPGGPGDLGTAYIADYGELLRNMSGTCQDTQYVRFFKRFGG